ncbi:MAG TPA: SUMF1/EgtB/PvdO family nonheme iron enzyme [Cyclobacteriaceae bacterium]|nr:SUMF1/EgtB/PvdO family nonheme iron enzyme [Cyclobacteriaceae bacterium]
MKQEEGPLPHYKVHAILNLSPHEWILPDTEMIKHSPLIRTRCIQVLVLTMLLGAVQSVAQSRIKFKTEGNLLTSVVLNEKLHPVNRPLVTFEIGQHEYAALQSPLKVEARLVETERGMEGTIQFTNPTNDTLTLTNVVPFGKAHTEAFVTGLGQHRLSRTHLFLPAKQPVNVIVPDNAWELGYAAIKLDNQQNLFGLTRRDPNTLVKATRKRFETILQPGGSVTYNFFADTYTGAWQEGMRIAFQKRYLYDVKSFDEELFNRADLGWMRKAYVMHLMMAWDKDFFENGQYRLTDFVKRGKTLYGGDDVICIWPTWPTLGVDQRNQFDLYRDLPGGLARLRVAADSMRALGTRFFIAYNPWDESTRSEGHLKGLAYLLQETSADGVVLDTKGESSKELQQAADRIKPEIIMYSEGMAVPKDMQGIISGRVHNALYYPPPLNLNKFIRPDFSIFRVAEVFKEPIQREYAVAFFNGYGTEINQFVPGHPEWEADQYQYLGRTTRILRENSTAFTRDFTPLVNSLRDSVWINQWQDPSRKKTLYTVLSFKPEGLNGPLVEIEIANHRLIDLWKHEEAALTTKDGKTYARVNIDGFDARYLGTNNEGDVSCLALFQKILDLTISGNRIHGPAVHYDVKIWKGNPDYAKEAVTIAAGSKIDLDIIKHVGRYEGKLVIQAFADNELIDEQILFLKPGVPRLMSTVKETPRSKTIPVGMVRIPAGSLKVKYTQGDEFIPYPKEGEGETISLPAYAMDKFPVTNLEFKNFMDATHYQPGDTSNFLKHWIGGKIPKGEEKFPVTFVSYEDAQAYAAWAGKRLPTELEWQYAAQTTAGNEWPWKQAQPVTREETYVTETLTVKNIKGINSKHANLGDGVLYPVGKYKQGVNPFGLYDLSGSVWQLTNDIYQSGSYQFIIMKGGSYFKPSSSWWYVQGGPRELHYRQFLLRVAPGFERNATVGFRCVKDLE